jgi:hypothetical protein
MNMIRLALLLAAAIYPFALIAIVAAALSGCAHCIGTPCLPVFSP